MRFATRHSNAPGQQRDGELLIVDQHNGKAVVAAEVAPTLQALLDDWNILAPKAERIYRALNAGERADAFELEGQELLSPLPRAYAFIDGSAYINHIVLVRKARNAEPPETLRTEPLVYQGGSDAFLAPTEPIRVERLETGADFESEIAVVTGDVPLGTSATEAAEHVRLVMLLNDVTLRNLIPPELAKGFGFFLSKPPSACSPIALTPDELGDAWQGGRVHLPLRTWLNGELFGDPQAGPEMWFSFFDLIEHCARTRPLRAGTIVGSGTVSNEDRARGSSCLAEKRMLEIIDTGKPSTPFLQYGDRVQIAMSAADGRDLFGIIDQVVLPLAAPSREAAP